MNVKPVAWIERTTSTIGATIIPNSATSVIATLRPVLVAVGSSRACPVAVISRSLFYFCRWTVERTAKRHEFRSRPAIAVSMSDPLAEGKADAEGSRHLLYPWLAVSRR